MRLPIPPSRRASRALAGALAALLAGAAAAQPSPVDDLTRNLALLDREPRNFDALVGAGDAALAIGDLPSAAAFYGRAAEVRPEDPGVLIGQGSVAVQMNQPERALQFFAAAQGRGGSAVAMGAGRGLAYDLLGQTRAAEEDYRAAMAGPRADEARRRLALNLAMGGDRTAAMALLAPLVATGDPAALRARAFVLALTGDTDNARRAIESAMPGAGAAIEPFLRRLPQLTPQQKAAAVHLGVFPTDAGAAAASAPRAAQAVPPAAAPAPAPRVAQASPPAAAPPSAPAPARTATRPPARPNPPVDAQASQVTTQERSDDDRRASAGTYEATGPMTYSRIRDAQLRRERRFADGGEPSDAPTAEAQAPETQAPAPPPAPRPVVGPRAAPASAPDTPSEPRAAAPDRLSGIERALAQPPAPLVTREVAAATPPPAPRPKYDAPPPPRPKVEAARPAPAPAVPAAPDIGVEGRWFVQLAGSDNRGAMGFEWRRLQRRAPDALAGRDPLLTRGVDFHRLLVGPFDDRGEAQALVNTLKAAGVDAFVWQRDPAALRIDPL
ncbi:SPOR domain-containing protein [Sphingomicrobium astaxanthinifaciens]|uniref:SPOR domain-containing protein n=1 Tax=Sphingomicrobium astaxanthinifaciens TaxID=1227949 RepID=UPI001FCB30E6|nr:SPOR domain-containing protein [Sphingomicrobium astaxanthinifaciens]MCJ7421646.1 SPOR domain-containing protein [Sphingomicrobium astaxanthinifaciens]